MPARNILILGHSNIGDVCSDLSVVGPLSRAFPGSRISFLTSPRLKSFVDGCRGINEVLVFDRHGKDKGFLRQLRLVLELRRRRFDLVLVLKSSLMFVFLGAGCVWRVRKKDIGGERHMIDVYLELLRRNGIRAVHGPVDLAFSQRESAFADKFLSEHRIPADSCLVGLSPFANWGLKCWPAEKWNELSGLISARPGMVPVLFGKAGGDALSEKLLKRLSPGLVSAVDRCSLRESAALISRCRAFVSCDSGLAYIADSLGIPCVTLSGPTNTDCYYPYLSAGLRVKSRRPPACAPCMKPPENCVLDAQGAPECMGGIEAVDVMERLLQALKGQI